MSEKQQQQDDTQGNQPLAVQETTTPQEIGELSFNVLLSPREIIALSQEQARALMEVVEQQQLYQIVKNRKFLQVEAWQLIGQFTHTRAIPIKLDQIEDDDRIRFRCEVELHNQAGEVVGAGSAEAHNKEEGKARLTENQIASTAQTRAISKAYRNKFAFIAKLAGFEATTAEEMTGSESSSQRSSQASQQAYKPTSQPNAKQASAPPTKASSDAESERSVPTAQEPTEQQPKQPTPNGTATREASQSDSTALKAYIECKEACLEHVDADIFVQAAIGLGYEGKKPSTLTTEELGALLDTCKKLGTKADDPGDEDEPMEPFPTPESEDDNVEQGNNEEAPF